MTQRQRWTRILSGVVGFGAVMDTFGAVVASRAIERSFHASPWAMRWVLSAYLLPLALLLPLGTRVGDRFGHRRTLVCGLMAFAMAAVACAAAPSVGMLIAARVLAGAGAAAAFSGALGLAQAADAADAAAVAGVTDGWYVPGHRLGVTFGVVLGPALAGVTAHGPGWRWYYGALAIGGGALAVAARLCLAEHRGRRHALDFEGPLVASVAVLGLIWALNRTVEIGWGTVEVIGALVLGVVAFGFLAVWNLPSGPLHRRRFLSANITELLFAASVFGPAYPAARDLQGVHGIGPLETGLGLTAWAAVASCPLALRFATGRRVLPRVCRPAGLILHCAGLAVLASTVRGAPDPATVIVALALSAVGVGLALGADLSVPGVPVPPVIGVVSLVGAVAGIAVLAATVPGFGAGAAASYHRELASALRGATVLAAAAAAASLAIPAASGTTAGPSGPLGRLCCRLALLPGRGIEACGGGSRSGSQSRSQSHPPGSCWCAAFTVT